MRQIRVVKSYTTLTQSLQSPSDLSYQDDMAVANFRAFHQVAHLHATRVSNSLARNVILEILDDLRGTLMQDMKNPLQNKAP